MPNVWVIKCREVMVDGSPGWHWREYFEPTTSWPIDDVFNEWGGSNWIQSSYSKKLLREDVVEGDIGLCYQKDDPKHGRAILGLTIFVSDGKEEEPGSGIYNCFDLCPPREAFVFDRALKIEQLYDHQCRPKCFGPGTQGTIFPVDDVEFDEIVNILFSVNHEEARRLKAWLKRAGYSP